jgi:hypothetical protein
MELVIQSFHKLAGGLDVTPRAILRADSLFEIALGLVLVAGAAASLLGPGDFPSPVGTPLVAIFGSALVPVGILLWRLSRGAVPSRLLRALATANLATGAAALVWRLAATGFSAAGSALTIAVACALAAVAAAQLYASARVRQRF